MSKKKMQNTRKTIPATEIIRCNGTSMAEGERSMTDKIGKWLIMPCLIVFVNQTENRVTRKACHVMVLES